LNITKRYFYGFWVVLSGFLVTTLSSGILYYGYTVMNKLIADDLGWNRAEITFAFLIFMMGMALFSPVAGRLSDTIGPRKVIIIGTVISSIALALASQTHAMWYFYVLHLFLGAGSVFTGSVPISTLIAKWFSKLRGTMQGLALGGIGFGGLVMGPLMGNFLAVDYGWRATYIIVAILLSLVILPLAFFIIRDNPGQKGLEPYGKGEALSPGKLNLKPLPPVSLNLKEALLTSAFWLIVLTSVFYCFSFASALQNQVSIFVWKGFTSASAITAIGVIGLFSTMGKFMFGFLCDRIDPKYSSAIAYALLGGAMVMMASATSMPELWVYTVLIGLGQGGWAPNLAMLTLRYFGIKHFGTVLGFIYLIFYAGQSVGPVIMGAVFDKTGDYIPMILILAAMCIISIPLIVIIRRPKKTAALSEMDA
jgi:MFS family permease